jgi:hypothetical protein
MRQKDVQWQLAQQSVLSGDNHTTSRRISKNSVRKRTLSKTNMMR